MRRIHVIGTSGSGKSTLARQLAERLGLKYVELDALFWLPKWTERPLPEFREKVAASVAEEAWVVDGNYRAKVRDLIWARADTIIWLDLPKTVVMQRVIRRTFHRWWRQQEMWGNREKLWTTLFSENSIVRWAWTTHGKLRTEYEASLGRVPQQVVRLRSHLEARKFLSAVGAIVL